MVAKRIEQYEGVDIPAGYRRLAPEELQEAGDKTYSVTLEGFIPCHEGFIGEPSGPLALHIREVKIQEEG